MAKGSDDGGGPIIIGGRSAKKAKGKKVKGKKRKAKK